MILRTDGTPVGTIMSSGLGVFRTSWGALRTFGGT
jgi:hypothetical protein